MISDENIGGAGILLLNLLSCFDRKEIESIVALPRQSVLMERLMDLKVPTVSLRHPCDRMSIASVREIAAHIEKSGAALVHANAALSARIAGRLCRVGVIHTRHCCFPPSGLFRFPPTRFLFGITNSVLSDRVIATADAARENLEALGIPRGKIDVIVNGSHPIRNVDGMEIAALQKKLDLQPSDFIVGICARLEACKGHRTFLEAAKLSLDASPEAHFRFLIVGDGSQRRSLEEYARELGISHAVRFVGFANDPAPYYRLMRINVNCSSGTETSCLALSEGMSASLPMIASDYGGNRAMIGDGRAGVLVPVGDAEALARQICKVARTPSLEKEMRKAAKARFEEHYTAERMAQEVAAVYRALLKDKAGNKKEIKY